MHNGECRVVMDTHLYHIVARFFLGSVVQRVLRWHLFGSCLVGDVSLLPLRRVTLENVVDVSILGLACELDQGLTSASLGLGTYTRQTDRGAPITKFHRWFLVSQDRDVVDVACMVTRSFFALLKGIHIDCLQGGSR